MTPDKYYTQNEPKEPHLVLIDLIDGQYEVVCDELLCTYKDVTPDYNTATQMAEDHRNESWQAL